MICSPYIIEYHGGRFDGLREPSELVIESTRLEMPVPDTKRIDGVSVRREVYEYRRSTVAILDKSPVVTFHVHHVGAKIAAPRPKLARRWIESICKLVGRFRPRPQLRPETADHGFCLPNGRRNAVLHGQN
jgi:hypothetical protein